jgi:cell wall-associated NlpC family hydrolase
VYDPGPQETDIEKADVSKSLVSIGYAIQAGAFKNSQNAARLTSALQKEGLDAYYFIHESGLYKVRFGDFPSKALAMNNAEILHAKGFIDVYYVVGPEDYPLAKARLHGEIVVREEIVKTAERFLGIPYQWGGTSAATGFDCSGLTAAVYELNGLKLPRSSKQQWLSGAPVDRGDLSKADLVFFATAGGRRVSHVGIYIEEDKFIHSPRKGKTIRYGSLSNGYFESRYLGARTYLSERPLKKPLT